MGNTVGNADISSHREVCGGIGCQWQGTIESASRCGSNICKVLLFKVVTFWICLCGVIELTFLMNVITLCTFTVWRWSFNTSANYIVLSGKTCLDFSPVSMRLWYNPLSVWCEFCDFTQVHPSSHSVAVNPFPLFYLKVTPWSCSTREVSIDSCKVFKRSTADRTNLYRFTWFLCLFGFYSV